MVHKFIFTAALKNVSKTKRAPSVNFAQCFNHKQRRLECKVCRDICPKNAITYDKQIRVDSELCNGCHLCHGSCPLRCISPSRAFIKHYDDTLQVCCKHGGAHAGIGVPCVASLPWDFYATLSHRSPIAIITGHCDTCAFGAREHVELIFAQLQSFFGDSYINKISRQTKSDDAEYSRREILGIFARKAKPPADVAISETYRDLLLGELDDPSAYNWPTFHINGSCVGCGVCEKLCPHEAIKMNGGKPSHNPLNCINCGLCKSACPKKSILLNGV